MNVVISIQDQIVILSIEGNLLGEHNGTPVMEGIKNHLDSGVSKFILDLKNLKFINSTGIGLIISVLTRVKNTGGELVLTNVPDVMIKVLKITKLEGVFTIFSTLDEAVDSFK